MSKWITWKSDLCAWPRDNSSSTSMRIACHSIDKRTASLRCECAHASSNYQQIAFCRDKTEIKYMYDVKSVRIWHLKFVFGMRIVKSVKSCKNRNGQKVKTNKKTLLLIVQCSYISPYISTAWYGILINHSVSRSREYGNF